MEIVKKYNEVGIEPFTHDIAIDMNITMKSAYSILDRLCKKGYLERKRWHEEPGGAWIYRVKDGVKCRNSIRKTCKVEEI